MAREILMKPLGWEKSYCLLLFYDYWLLITECFKEISVVKIADFFHITVIFLLSPSNEINSSSKFLSNPFSTHSAKKAFLWPKAKMCLPVALLQILCGISSEENTYKRYGLISWLYSKS